MPATLRLKDKEQEALRKKCIKINKLLVEKEKKPITESELAHFLLEKSIACVELSDSGELLLALP